MSLNIQHSSFNICIVGSGNVAHFVGKKLLHSQHIISQVISSNIEHAKVLANILSCDFSDTISAMKETVDVVILAINDDALKNFQSNEILKNKLIIHTAGAVSLEEVKHISDKMACIWPVYSISKNNLPSSSHIPLAVNFSSIALKDTILNLAQSMSSNVFLLNDEQKMIAHVSAVFANNFSNHLFAIAEKLLDKQHIPFDILMPLIKNTVEKLNNHSPADNQTGPAIRKDEKTIQKHVNLLTDSDKIIYEMLTKSIQELALTK
jgi:predicted short-subunit dehydrogenase-like oxidoreductase (DUF2520 family)